MCTRSLKTLNVYARARYTIICPYIYIFFRVYKIVRNIRCLQVCFLFLFSFLFLIYSLVHALNSALSFSRRIIVFKYPLTYRRCLYTSRKILVMLSSRVITNGRGRGGGEGEGENTTYISILHTNCSRECSHVSKFFCLSD